MCDNVAVTWANYEQNKMSIETETRHKIYSDIQDIIDQSKLQGISDQFIAGLECAQAKVLGFTIEEKEPDAESVLFQI
jgi:hypothetical protein